MTPEKAQDDRGRHVGGSPARQRQHDCREAGHKGGKIGGHKNSQRTRELIEEGKRAEGRDRARKRSTAAPEAP